MAIEKFDAETLKKLQSTRRTEPSQPENGATTPAPERIREAIKEANDPRRLVSVTPGFYSPRE